MVVNGQELYNSNSMHSHTPKSPIANKEQPKRKENFLGDNYNRDPSKTFVEKDMPSELKRRATYRRDMMQLEVELVDHETAKKPSPYRRTELPALNQ